MNIIEPRPQRVRPQTRAEQKLETNMRFRERRELSAAFDAMCAARPLKPPPYNFERARVSAAQLALRADIREGVWS